jgi:hypothetical protein
MKGHHWGGQVWNPAVEEEEEGVNCSQPAHITCHTSSRTAQKFSKTFHISVNSVL